MSPAPDGEPEVQASHLLLAMGRTPNTDLLSLEKAGLTASAQGFVSVDEQLRTSVPGIWALGDCNGRGAFTHTAYNDFEIVAANLLDSDPRKLSDRIPVHALFIDPPLAQVGMTEKEVRDGGLPALIGTRPNEQSRTCSRKGRSPGFHKNTRRSEVGYAPRGFNPRHRGADEAIHSILAGMYSGKAATVIQRSMYIHPTVAELIPTVLGELKPPRLMSLPHSFSASEDGDF